MPTDPDPVLRLLWRHAVPTVDAAPRRGDAEGLAALSMRSLAQRLGIGAMSVYGYVANRNDLIVLMVDQVLGEATLPPMEGDLRTRLRLVAEVQLADGRTHPWLLDVVGLRPWLGPNAADRYEWQLAAVDGIGLSDVEMDQTVTLVAGFAANVARAEHAVRVAERESGVTDLEWWEANSEELGRLMAGRDYPIAGRVGQAAGEAYQAGTSPQLEREFGLERIIDGVEAHLARK